MSDVQVSQAARDAVANYVRSDRGWSEESPTVKAIREGKASIDLVQAFARFEQDVISRLATRPAPVGEQTCLWARNGHAACTRPALDVDGLVEKVARAIMEAMAERKLSDPEWAILLEDGAPILWSTAALAAAGYTITKEPTV